MMDSRELSLRLDKIQKGINLILELEGMYWNEEIQDYEDTEEELEDENETQEILEETKEKKRIKKKKVVE